MDRSTMEILEVELGKDDSSGSSLLELKELQLALVGGGSADPIYH